MSTQEIRDYYDSTEYSDVRPDLIHAVSLLGDERVAIDCGCGAGSDIAFLRDNDFMVHAFDIEAESVKRCRERFKGDEKVHLSRAGFSSFMYPQASLVVADASLFFCPPAEFKGVWCAISESLVSRNGVFCGSFLGPNDTMAGQNYKKDAFWPEVSVFTEQELRRVFIGYEVDTWTEHQMSGETAQGVPHDWHIFSIVARKA